MHCVFFYMCCSLSIFISLLSKWGGWALIYYYLTLYWQLYWHSLPAVRIKSWQPLFKDRNKNTLQSRKYVYPYKKKNERRCFSKTASATGFPDKFGIGNVCERSELRLQKKSFFDKKCISLYKIAFWAIFSKPIPNLLGHPVEQSLNGRINSLQTISSGSWFRK